jgi:SAM-dependent methyltransferase
MGDELWSVYDEMGIRFQRHAANGTYNAHYDRPAMQAALGPVAGLRVLDAACGPGFLLETLLDDGAICAGFDASTAMLSLARDRLGDRAELIEARLGEPLPYPDGRFDVVACALAIHYVRDRAAAFAELRRVLRPGGRLVASTQHPFVDWLRKGGSYFDTVLEADVWQLPDGPQTVRFWREPLSALTDAALDAGFLIERLIEPLPAPSMREADPAEFETLTTRPGFLILALRNPG